MRGFIAVTPRLMKTTKSLLRTALPCGVFTLLAAALQPALADANAKTAAQPPAKALAKAQGATACQPPDTSALTCELKDGRLLSLCSSPGFSAFKGNPEDHPGHAYVAISKGKNTPRFTYPPDPTRYRQHMYSWVTYSAVPHMHVESERGPFLGFTIDPEEPVDVMYEHAPKGWFQATTGDELACARRIQRDDLDPFMAILPKRDDWEKARRADTKR